MKNLTRFVIAITATATSVFAVSCTRLEYKEDLSGGGKVFHASFETVGIPDTKTYLDSGHKMLWTEDDRLSVFEGNTENQQYRYTGQTGNATADFEKVQTSGLHSGNDISSNYAVYPYLQDNLIDNDGKLTVTLPAVQQYAAGSFGLGANTMVAVTDGTGDTFLAFKNLCGYLVIRLYGEGTVKSISFKGNNGEKIAGAATITASYGQNPSVSMVQTASDEIILDCGNGVELGSTSSTATEFWFCIPPVEFSKGFSITVTDTAGGVMEKSLSISRIISRNAINSMSALKTEFSEPAIPVPEMVDLGLSVKWASFNIGASSPEEHGGYYQWAGTKDVSSTSIYLDWSNCPYHTGSDENTGWTKYDYSSDCKTVLDPEDDIAYTALGSKWRMPTYAEWWELYDNCKWTWTTQNEVSGYKITGTKPGYTDKSIFLPVTGGYRSGCEMFDDGPYGYYWSSSLNAGYLITALYVCFNSNNLYGFANYRHNGKSVRPVYGDRIRVTGVSLNPTSISLEIGESTDLNVKVAPSNATEQGFCWTSSDTGIVTVDRIGKVTAGRVGSATITVTTADGGYTATCSVTVKAPELAVPEMVDLGLSVKWASFNIGATKPEEYGGYYQWAGIQDVTNIYIDWSNCPYHTGEKEDTGWTKYIPTIKPGSDNPDGKTVLDPEDDVVQVILGGKWRMPTCKEWEELKANCIWTWTKLNGVNGYKVTGKKTGYKDKWIFLPAAGCRLCNSMLGVGSSGNFWSSSLTMTDPSYAELMIFESDYIYVGYSDRYYGRSVRPVYSNKVNVTGVSLNPTSLNLNVGETSTLCATVTPSNAADKSVSWTSSNTDVATVDQSGKVTAVKAGSATITVTTTDGGYTATCSVAVKNSDNPLVGTSWTCSISDEARYNTNYIDITLTFDSQSTFIMTEDVTNVEKERDIERDLDGDGIIDYREHIEGGTYHYSETVSGTYTVNGTSLKLLCTDWIEPIYGTISGSTITLFGDEDIILQKR